MYILTYAEYYPVDGAINCGVVAAGGTNARIEYEYKYFREYLEKQGFNYVGFDELLQTEVFELTGDPQHKVAVRIEQQQVK